MKTLEQMQWDEIIEFLKHPPVGRDYRIDECWNMWMTWGGTTGNEKLIQDVLEEIENE